MTLANQPKLEIGSGSAHDGDPFTTGKNAAVQAISTIHSCPVVAVVVFASVKYDLKEVLQGIRSIIPDALLFGCTTAGEICNGTFHESVVVTVLASPYMKVSCGLGKDVSKNRQAALDDVFNAPGIHPYFHDVENWRNLTLRGNSAFAILFSPGNTRLTSSQSYDVLEAIKLKSLGRLPVFGGSTADDWGMEANYILCGEEVFPDSMFLAIFETQLQFGIAMDHGFLPTSHKATVTRAEGHEVLELDGIPANYAYSRMVGSTLTALEGKHLTLTTGHTMGTADPMEQYNINVASYFTPCGGIRFTQPVTAGTVLTLMEPNSEQMLLAGKEALRKAMIRGGVTDPALSLVAYCALRPPIIGERSQDEIRGMTEFLAGSPLVGFCSFGEQGVGDDGTIRHNNAVTSVLVLGNELSPTACVYLENEKMRRTLEQQALALSHTNKELQNAHDELEARVKERTSELSAANELLRHEITERKRAEETLRNSQSMLARTEKIAHIGSWAWERTTGKVTWSDEMFQILRRDPAEGAPSFAEQYKMFHTEDMGKLIRLVEIALSDGTPYELEMRAIYPDGEIRICLATCFTESDSDGRVIRLFGSTQDITERKQVELRLKQHAMVFENSQEGIVITDAQARVIDANAAFERITEYDLDEIRGENLRFLQSGRHDRSYYLNMWNSIEETGGWQGEIWNRRKGGEIYLEWISICAIKNEKDEIVAYTGTSVDINRMNHVQCEIEYLAHYDALTGLPNRLLLMSRLGHALDRVKRGGSGAVLFIDLDRFKPVNDTFGHKLGDELLQAVSERLRDRLRDADTLARLGGDEFVIILEDVQATESIEIVAQEVIRQLKTPFDLSEGRTVNIGGSVGIALFPKDGTDVTQLIDRADQALYAAKNAGKGVYRFFCA